MVLKKEEKLIKRYLIVLFILSGLLLLFEEIVPLKTYSLLEVSESPLTFIDKTFCFEASIIDQKIFLNSSFFVLYDSIIVKGKFFNFATKIPKEKYYFIGKSEIKKEKIEINLFKFSISQFEICR